MARNTLSLLLLANAVYLAAGAKTSSEGAAIGANVASAIVAAAALPTAVPPATTLATRQSNQQPLTCAIVAPDPDAIPAVEAHCSCMPINKNCPQYSTVGMYHSDVCRGCETSFIELSTAHSEIPQETIVSACAVQSQVGVNQNQLKSLENCGRPFTSTISGTIYEWPGQVVTQVSGFAGTDEVAGAVMTLPVGSSTPVATVAPTITAISATGSPDDSTQGVWVGPMTGSDLWYNISSAVEAACTGDVFPMTACAAEPVITGVPYPKAASDPGLMPELDYGELRIQLTEVSMKSAKERSLFAYYLGMNAAASIKRMGKDACKKLHTSHWINGRVGGFQSPREPLMGCFMPLEFVLFQSDGGQTELPDSLMWSKFYFTGEHGQASQLQCQAVNSVVNGILAVVMAGLALIPGGGVAANGVRTGVQRGSVEARGLGIRAVQAGEAIKFGCKSIEDAKNGDNSDLSSGHDASEDATYGLLDSLLGDGSEENPWVQDLRKISDTWEQFSGFLGM